MATLQKMFSFSIILCCSGFFLLQANETVVQTIGPPIREGKDHAVFFAIEDYTEWGDLVFPLSDAQQMAKDLAQHYNFEVEVVKNPSKREIFKKLEEYRNKAYPDDGQLFLFFSGHGAFTERSREGFFVPADGLLDDPYQESYLPHQRLESIVNAINCPHILLAIDACYSGTFDQSIALRGNANDDRPGAKKNARQQFIKRSLQYPSRLYLTSGGKEQTPDRSQFAQQFLSALRSFGGQDGILTFSELVAHLESARPLPRNGKFGSHQPGGNFLFVTDRAAADEKKENPTPGNTDLQAWQEAKAAHTEASYKQYLQQFPTGLFKEKADLALLQIEGDRLEEADWKLVTEVNTPKAYRTFIRKFPNGKYTKGMLRDKRDGQQYPWVRLTDGRKWMAKNLNFAAPNSHCYEDKRSNCTLEGRLYEMEHLPSVCPEGWRLPNVEEFNEMYFSYTSYFRSFMNPEQVEVATVAALTKNGMSGFDIIYSGEKNKDGSFSNIGRKGSYWIIDNTNPFIFGFYANGFFMSNSDFDQAAYSCRCIQN